MIGREVAANLQDGLITMNKILGEPITHALPLEITDESNEASRRVVELSTEALNRIEQIEASARASELKSGSLILR